MFGKLTERFQSLFKGIAGKRTLTEANVSEAVREVRLALLDADVGYGVAKAFIARVKEKALGDSVLKSIKAGDQFTKIIHDELIALMGSDEATLALPGHPSIIMLCGLQGSGKTTTAAKLAHYLKSKNKKPILVACDLQRPAAIDQLCVLGQQIDVPVCAHREYKDPLRVALEGIARAKREGFDVVILDTAGRLHIDDDLMSELGNLAVATKPDEILFVASSAIGQTAVETAKAFNERLEISGTILTMLDGNTRAGAAISIREVTGKPLKFEGIGEKVEDLQLFNPRSMADRILGMGDVINLVKKAEEHIGEQDEKELEKKFRKANITYNDYLKQMGMIKKMGSMKGLLSMMPGMSALGDLDASAGKLSSIEAIVLSMTPQERDGLVELEPSRRRRIAKGSGTTIDDVNRLVKGFKQIKKVLKQLPSIKKMFRNGGGMEELTKFF